MMNTHDKTPGRLQARPIRSMIRASQWILAASICYSGMTWAQDAAETNKKPKPEKLFASEQTLEVTLSAPWRTLKKKKKIEDPYPAVITFTDNLGAVNEIPLTVERRGLTRQTVCKFPPIKMKFEKEQVKGTVFRGQKSLKLVTHCDKGNRWEQYYIKEMLAYQMYNLITDYSFKVRPLTVTYVDSEENDAPDTHFGFVIEDDSDVAKRNDFEKLKRNNINHTLLDGLVMTQFSVFQYMIANVDWSALKGPGVSKCCHNARLIGDEQQKIYYAVPYDFDSSGFVDAHYAAPNPALPINKVTQRLYRGYCINNKHLDAVRKQYLSEEPAIIGLVQNEPRLSKATRTRAIRYLDDFFDTLKSQKKFDKSITGKCRK